MIRNQSQFNAASATFTQTSAFELPNGEVSEMMAMIHVSDVSLSYNDQLNNVIRALNDLQDSVPDSSIVFVRFFLSDSANQTESLLQRLRIGEFGAVSFVEQPPLDGSKIAVWAYIQTNVQVRILDDGMCEVKNEGCVHYWAGTSIEPVSDSEHQMSSLFTKYISSLAGRGCSLASNCIRTWIFVQNVDVNYAGIVKARNEIFAEQGLSPKTHFICSTGIQGRNADPKAIVQLNAYAVSGLAEDQIQYLHASSRMSPTSKYGVSFERGTCVHYSDRAHVFISGTASIDSEGHVMHPRDVRLQVERLWGNVEALLAEAQCSFDDVVQMIVYLRDMSDYPIVRSAYDKRFPETPTVFVSASVCRPSWLVEMECMAIRP